MGELIDVAVVLLLVVAVAPLVLLGLYVIADRLGLRVAERVLDVTAGMLTAQWITGGLVNVVGGLGIAALGLWAVAHAHEPLTRILAALLVTVGLWRVWRGVVVLRSGRRDDEGPARDAHRPSD